MQHLADRLQNQYPHYVMVPAMNYFNPKIMQRVEEGPAIVSQYPIITSDYILLSRSLTDGQDEHQRLCLHVLIDIPSWGLVDVYSVHLSLVEEARDASVIEIWNFVKDYPPQK